MATPFRLKRSAVTGKRPALADLQTGELALNTFDGYLFATKDTNGVGIGTTVTLLTPWIENFGGESIYYNQFVGIGTTNPQTTLEINGVLGFTGRNIRIGDSYTGCSITSGAYNIFLGTNAGRNTTTGNYNIFLGERAGYCNTSGINNNFLGDHVGYFNTTGRFNNFLGSCSGYCNTSGCYNNFFGRYTGRNNTIGNCNNFIGFISGENNTTGHSNNFFGSYSGLNNIDGSHNVFLGSFTGISTTANNKIILGSGYDPITLFDSPNVDDDYQFAVGLRTDTNQSRYWLVGNQNFNIGIGDTNPTSKLSVGGDVKISGFVTATNAYISGITTVNALQIYGSLSVGGTTGNSGQYLRSTGTGVVWESFSSLRNTYNYSATSNQKIFTASGITTGFVDVFVNGIRIDESNYSIVGTGISLNVGSIVNDEITIVGYNTVNAGSGGGGGGATNLNGLTDVTITSPTNGQVLKFNGSEWVNGTDLTGGGGGGSSLSVSKRPGIGGVDTTEVSNVTALRFDSNSGFNVTDLGSGEVFVDLGSTFNPWYVAGQGTLKANGEEPIEFIAGPGIAITTKAVASVGIGTTFSKAITISVTGGGGGSSVGTGITLGTPTDGSLSDGLLSWTASTSVTDAIDEVNEILNKLAPPKPQNLSAITSLTLATSNYSAIESSTGITRSNVVSSTTPSSSATAGFYDGDSGTLSAWIDGSQASSRVLSTANDSGTYGSLIIASDTDPYVGQAGKAGFWKELTARVQSASALAVGIHTYQLKHSGTGNSGLLSFYVDNPVTTSISSQSFSLTGASTAYVSGVPTLSNGATFTVTFTVNDAIKQFYNSTRIADVSGGSILSSTVQHSLSGVQTDQSITTTKTCTVGSGKYSESNSLTIIPYNSAGNSGTTASVSLGARVDTVSNESSRKIAGSGQYPTSGYGGSFDSTQNLRTSYTEELQLISGRYQWPSATNYSSNVPTAGPDYSTGMGSGDRWYLYQHGSSLSNISAFTLNINGASGFSGTETSGVKIYAKVEGVTGWIDCNSSYPGSGNPSSDGDPAMVFGSSTATSKRVTFGTSARSGTLYIRIGLPAASSKYFTSLSVTLG